MRKKLKEYFNRVTQSEVGIAFSALIGAGLILFLITIAFDPDLTFPWAPNLGLYNHPGFWENVLVESHGMLLDLLILGVFIFWLQRRAAKKQEKKNRIQRYKEELDDYRGWTENEAAYRVAGIIRRLKKEGVENIDFKGLHLGRCSKEIIKEAYQKKHIFKFLSGAGDLTESNFPEMMMMYGNAKNLDLSFSNLERAWLTDSDLEGIQLIETNLQKANLHGTSLKNADLWGAIFDKADLREVDLVGAKVDSKDWFEKLKRWQVKGVEEIISKFYVDPTRVIELGSEYYIIKEKRNSIVFIQCEALTNKGNQCKRKAKPGFDKCTQHLKK